MRYSRTPSAPAYARRQRCASFSFGAPLNEPLVASSVSGLSILAISGGVRLLMSTLRACQSLRNAERFGFPCRELQANSFKVNTMLGEASAPYAETCIYRGCTALKWRSETVWPHMTYPSDRDLCVSYVQTSHPCLSRRNGAHRDKSCAGNGAISGGLDRWRIPGARLCYRSRLPSAGASHPWPGSSRRAEPRTRLDERLRQRPLRHR